MKSPNCRLSNNLGNVSERYLSPAIVVKAREGDERWKDIVCQLFRRDVYKQWEQGIVEAKPPLFFDWDGHDIKIEVLRISVPRTRIVPRTAAPPNSAPTGSSCGCECSGCYIKDNHCHNVSNGCTL